MPNEKNIEKEMQRREDVINTLAMQQEMEKTAKIAEQEQINKSHDTEFTEFSDLKTKTIEKVGTNEIQKAFKTLMDYKSEKAELESKIIENEEFWKMNHWDVVYKGDQKAFDKRVKPKSAWLFNLIINKHADAMDNFPEANILPRARDDEKVAEVLSQVVPVVLEQNNYEDTYSDAQWYKCKNGLSAQGVFWNNDKQNGLGDIEIKKVDVLNLYWKGTCSDIQDSPNVFHVTMVDNDELKEMYPELKEGGNTYGLSTTDKYMTGANNTNQSAVIDWYYKKRVRITDELGVPKMKTVLHYCKFCNEQVIYASENDPNYSERGWYDHGDYPFVVDVLFPTEGSVAGIGYIDIEKDDQIFIDKMQQAILESALVNARPRYFIKNDGMINEDEFLDLSMPLIHTDGNLTDRDLVPVANSQFNAVYENVFLQKINELKETSGNTNVAQGISHSGQSGSAIASLQEASGKLSRDSNNTSYRAFKKVVHLVIELMRQFYNEPRCFRITGDRGESDYVTFDNSGLLPQEQGSVMGLELGSRLPIMDIEVKPQKRNAYSKESQNQTALQLYNMGFFAPNNADASLACLEMMDFDQIEKMRDKVQQNGTLFDMVMQMQQQIMQYQQMLMQMGQIMDAKTGTHIADAVSAEAQQQSGAVAQKVNAPQMGGGSIKQSKGSLSKQASEVARSSTSPR